MFVHTMYAGMCLDLYAACWWGRPVPACASEQSGRGPHRLHVHDIVGPCLRTGALDGAPIDLRGPAGVRVECSLFGGPLMYLGPFLFMYSYTSSH